MTKDKLLDKHQRQLSSQFAEGYLSSQDHINRLIEWCDYYRHNLHRFATHYFGLSLYPYQRLMLYQMGNAEETDVIAARAAAKSFVTAIFSCCEAVLRPHSQIIIAAGTLKQAKAIVVDKIGHELMSVSANLRKEIEKISVHGDDVAVFFKNGSIIKVVVANDNARSNRSTILIVDEARMVKLSVVTRVLSQFQHVRNAPFKDRAEYAHLSPEESKTILLSSAWFRSNWLWGSVKTAANHVIQNDARYALLAFDHTLTLRHKIKTRSQLIKDRRRMDPTSWLMESCAVFAGETENSFFEYELFANAQTNKQPLLYPRQNVGDPPPRKGSCLPHQSGEVRVLSVDLAFVQKSGNDNTVMTVVRLLPEHQSDDIIMYRKVVSYMEHHQGGDTVEQAKRIKEVFYDVEADYVVLDVRGGGAPVYDMLARPVYDEGSGVEFPAWRCMNDENFANRVRIDGAEEILYAVSATQKLNSDIAQLTRRELSDGHVSLPAQHDVAIDEILPKIKAYTDAIDMDITMFYESPYLETQALINECVALRYDRLPDTGIIKISEVGNNTKDRFSSFSYALYFANMLERDLLSVGGQYEYRSLIN